MRDPLEGLFPKLSTTRYKRTSPATSHYNCIAWAMHEDTIYWDPHPQYYWPPDAKRGKSLDDIIDTFKFLGFVVCKDDSLEIGFEKIAIYCKDGNFQHVARQMSNGVWTSKLAQYDDIEHELAGLTGDYKTTYGEVKLFMKKAVQCK